jgi:hypothetical protein
MCAELLPSRSVTRTLRLKDDCSDPWPECSPPSVKVGGSTPSRSLSSTRRQKSASWPAWEQSRYATPPPRGLARPHCVSKPPTERFEVTYSVGSGRVAPARLCLHGSRADAPGFVLQPARRPASHRRGGGPVTRGPRCSFLRARSATGSTLSSRIAIQVSPSTNRKRLGSSPLWRSCRLDRAAEPGRPTATKRRRPGDVPICRCERVSRQGLRTRSIALSTIYGNLRAHHLASLRTSIREYLIRTGGASPAVDSVY